LIELEDKLIEILSGFRYPVMLQGSLSENEDYPPHFFTFWNNDSASDSFYDNKDHSLVCEYDVNFYSSDPELVYTKLREAIEELKKQGFIISGDGYSVASDEPTHDGRGVHVLYRKN